MSQGGPGRPASVKITDVAALAGVAPMTVSRVMNTPERVAPDTAARVRAAIEALGYVPNLIAGGLSSRRSRMIAAIVPTIASPMFAEPVQTFTDAMDRAGYHVLLGLSGYADGGEDALIHATLSRRPDGLLLTGGQRSAATRKLLADSGVPVVEIWDKAERHTDMQVGFDHAEVGAAVADFFVAGGHTRFAVIAAGDSRARARRQGFVSRVAHHAGTLVAERATPSPSGIIDGRTAFREIARDLPTPKDGPPNGGSPPGRLAMLCSSDLVAFGVVTEAAILGIPIPGRLAVCGFGDFEISRGSVPAITTVRVDGGEMGRLAAQHLLTRISARTRASAPGTTAQAAAVRDATVQVVVPFHIIERETT